VIFLQECPITNYENIQPVLDTGGYAECPDCGTRIHCGTVGLLSAACKPGKATPQNEDLPGNKGKTRQERASKEKQIFSVWNLNRHQ
jgi:hypothetical protein